MEPSSGMVWTALDRAPQSTLFGTEGHGAPVTVLVSVLLELVGFAAGRSAHVDDTTNTVDPTVSRASSARCASPTSLSGYRVPMCGRTFPARTISKSAWMPSRLSSGVA